jgi:hypothetical protein
VLGIGSTSSPVFHSEINQNTSVISHLLLDIYTQCGYNLEMNTANATQPMYRITSIDGYANPEPMWFHAAIQVLRNDMYLSEKDIALAKQADKFTFVYGFASSLIEKV